MILLGPETPEERVARKRRTQEREVLEMFLGNTLERERDLNEQQGGPVHFTYKELEIVHSLLIRLTTSETLDETGLVTHHLEFKEN